MKHFSCIQTSTNDTCLFLIAGKSPQGAAPRTTNLLTYFAQIKAFSVNSGAYSRTLPEGKWIMTSYALTAEHWQAALEVPKQIALDLAAPLNLRLQAVRMVQAMLKVILKDEKDRDAPKDSARQPRKAGAIPSTSWACAMQSDTTTEQPSPSHADDANNRVRGDEQVAEKETGASNPSSPTASTEPAETRTRYIGRVGPRKIRKKRK